MDDTDWSLMDFSEPKKAGVEKSAPAPSVECLKCGKSLPKRGAHFHINRCQGDERA